MPISSVWKTNIINEEIDFVGTYLFLVEDVVIDDRLLVWNNIFVCVSWVGESCKFFFEPGLQVGHDLLVLLEDIFTPLALKKESQAKL